MKISGKHGSVKYHVVVTVSLANTSDKVVRFEFKLVSRQNQLIGFLDAIPVENEIHEKSSSGKISVKVSANK